MPEASLRNRADAKCKLIQADARQPYNETQMSLQHVEGVHTVGRPTEFPG